jgi:hypothetical protein
MLSIVMPDVILLNVVRLDFVMLSVTMLCPLFIFMMSVILLIGIDHDQGDLNEEEGSVLLTSLY